MLALQEQNYEIGQATEILAQRLFGEIEAGGDMNTIRRIAVFGEAVAAVARSGGGFVELYQATEYRLEQLDRKLTLMLARAGFGPEERLVLLPQLYRGLMGTPKMIPVGRPGSPVLEGGDVHAIHS